MLRKTMPEERERIMSILQIPPDSTIPERIRKVMQYTNLSYRSLLGKWLQQEEASIEAAKRAEKKVLKQFKTRIDILEKQILRLEEKPLRTGKPSQAAYKRSLVFQVLSMRKAGKTYKQIAELFNREGTRTISGRGKWSPTAVMQLLYDKKK